MTRWQGADRAAVDDARTHLFEALAHWPEAEADRVRDAAEFAEQAHADQRRRSGEPYVCHPLAVAAIVAGIGGEPDTVIAAVLHDVVEDTPTRLDEISIRFGSSVASLVDGCTKVGSVRADNPSATEAARIRKLLVAIARDPRVLVVKLADRLHNMRTIDALAPAKKQRIGRETLALHGPLAHRLGIGGMKAELEDRAYQAVDPDAYRRTREALDRPELKAALNAARERLAQHLADTGTTADVTGRIKHAWSAQRKAAQLDVAVEDLHDLIGLRVIVPDLAGCYTALGTVHALWSPVPGRFKDYIAAPKFNSYQSLHTTVTTDDGTVLEVQIRTPQMHADAERGQAAHHAYKHPDGDEPAWLRRLLDWRGDEPDDDAYLAGVRAELAGDEELYVLTPAGEVLVLPAGAGVLDFAYAVHSQVGDRCSAAEVNGRIMPLSTRLRSGDRVHIVTGRDTGPPLAWLDWVVTSKARSSIRAFHQRTRRQEARRAGDDLVNATLSQLGVPRPVFDAAAERGSTLAETLERIGRGQCTVAAVLDGRHAGPPRDSVAHDWQASTLVVGGAPSLTVRPARCCRISRGADVIGVREPDGTCAAHQPTCPIAAAVLSNDPGLQHRLDWCEPGSSRALIEVTARNRRGLLADVARALTAAGATIESSVTEVRTDGTAREEFEVTHPLGDLRQVLANIATVPGVQQAVAVESSHDSDR